MIHLKMYNKKTCCIASIWQLCHFISLHFAFLSCVLGVPCDVDTVTSTTIEILASKAPGNFSLITVTDVSNQNPRDFPVNGNKSISLSGLAPGMNHYIRYSNGSSFCCQVWTSEQDFSFGVDCGFRDCKCLFACSVCEISLFELQQ